MSYAVKIAAAPSQFMEKLRDQTLARRLIHAMRCLGENPRPPGAVKLAGPDNFWRVRVGDYRIVYLIQDAVLLVLVVKVGHRREIYR